MPKTDPALRLSDLRVRYDERTENRPNGVSFDVARGEVVLVLGPSGCGKSTLALALNGLVPHALAATMTGFVTVNGIRTTDAPVSRLSQEVAMVFQDPDAQIVTGTVLDEVCFGPENLLLPVAEVLERSEHALRAVGLWERRLDNPDVLSGGGKQRLAIACALAMDTPILVLDEPTANLDPVGIRDVYAVLGDIAAAGTHAVVLIEHNLDAAIDLVDRVVVLDGDGALAVSGPTREVLAGSAEELAALGVWLPVATLAGLRLRRGGIELDSLPLTPDELANMLNGIRSLPVRPANTPKSSNATGDVAVAVRNLTVTRAKTRILHDVSLEIGAGDFVTVIGANGAGKTTLVQALAGVVAPPRGTVRIGDLDPATSDARALAEHVGFVFQNPEHQFLENTVFDELAHGLRVRRRSTPGLSDAEIEVRVAVMLERFGLERLRDAHPFLLSGGQKRRLSVGTALITGAPVLVLDEPTFGQDRERANELLALLSGLHRSGTTVITVTHDLQLVAEYASHVAVMHDGRLLAFGAAGDILGDQELLERAGLSLPPLARAMRGVTSHPSWSTLTRIADLPESIE
ncbi:ABC transporter ATP-binding protein [Mycetocola zhadangensis]|uniref:ABC transporter ATP-binding protein n=1 Tax=Mycetocola zhadangensis TaxID=1164595 RepID=A0A3L7J1Z8_9MICO|nr:ABC transporter ATP-binding protein [Mycetocola zhadangensis]RLQ84547.1 ABC transporter ATP-binding protein [Mycetocola zhadangensis]GGE92004.1 putative HMP/thiamine import ATP-binding protein YkoD [Mycetocola zhadangensis]